LAFELRSAQVDSPAGLIETCHVVWHPEVVTITANEVMQPTDGQRSERDAAVEWLQDVLADGPRSAKALRGMAADAGFAWPTLRRAKDELGIKPSKTRFDGGWEWALPAKMLIKLHEDAHTPQVEHLRRENGQKPYRNAASSEGAHMSAFEDAHPSQDAHEDAHPEHLRQNPHSKAISGVKNHEDAQARTVSTFRDGEHLRETMPVDDAAQVSRPATTMHSRAAESWGKASISCPVTGTKIPIFYLTDRQAAETQLQEMVSSG
jgi:hypothetical protein